VSYDEMFPRNPLLPQRRACITHRMKISRQVAVGAMSQLCPVCLTLCWGWWRWCWSWSWSGGGPNCVFAPFSGHQVLMCNVLCDIQEPSPVVATLIVVAVHSSHFSSNDNNFHSQQLSDTVDSKGSRKCGIHHSRLPATNGIIAPCKLQCLLVSQ
jgi:hypothetical protein